MRSRPENTEPATVIGYLGRDSVLYCSRDCAASRVQKDAVPVDQDEYQALVDRGTLNASDVVCPVCGSEYPQDWPEQDERS